MVFTVIICILAGCGAGLTTGFAGLSAAVYITPMLVAFLKVPVYEAVGISLASDVLASAISAYTYARQGNIDLKKGKILLFLVLTFTIIGSIIAYVVTSVELGDSIFGYWSIIGSLLMGIMFILRPQTNENTGNLPYSDKRKLMTVLMGIFIGFICGFQGIGGGMWLLFTLTVVMLFRFKTAVGTSVFIMTFTALIGAISHFLINGMPDTTLLLICVASTVIFARIGAVVANRISPTSLKRTTGIMLTVSCIFMLIYKIWG